MTKRLLAARGIHYLVSRFGWPGIRSLAFDAKYERGDWSFQNDGKGELANAVTQYLNGGDLLILGCGGASILEAIPATALNSALGIDLSPEAIRLASRFESESISFMLADMEAFECPHPFDVILFSESLYYVRANRQVQLLMRLRRTLKSRGVFIVTLAEPLRYGDILRKIRTNFAIDYERRFLDSVRHLIIFH